MDSGSEVRWTHLCEMVGVPERDAEVSSRIRHESGRMSGAKSKATCDHKWTQTISLLSKGRWVRRESSYTEAMVLLRQEHWFPRQFGERTGTTSP